MGACRLLQDLLQEMKAGLTRSRRIVIEWHVGWWKTEYQQLFEEVQTVVIIAAAVATALDTAISYTFSRELWQSTSFV